MPALSGKSPRQHQRTLHPGRLLQWLAAHLHTRAPMHTYEGVLHPKVMRGPRVHTSMCSHINTHTCARVIGTHTLLQTRAPPAGRAGHHGTAVTLLTPADASFKGKLECLLSPAKAAAAAAAAAVAQGGSQAGWRGLASPGSSSLICARAYRWSAAGC